MKDKGNDSVGNNPTRDLWQTEQGFWDKLNGIYNFGFDCCATEEDSKTREFSSNFQSVGRVYTTAWMNPPFSKARDMFEHFFKVVSNGVAIYRFDNAETKIWQEVIFPNSSWVFIPKGRIPYTPFDITIRGGITRFPSALIGLNVKELEGIEGVTIKPIKLSEPNQ